MIPSFFVFQSRLALFRQACLSALNRHPLRKLLPDAQFLDDGTISFDIDFNQVIE